MLELADLETVAPDWDSHHEQRSHCVHEEHLRCSANPGKTTYSFWASWQYHKSPETKNSKTKESMRLNSTGAVFCTLDSIKLKGNVM